MLKIPAYRMTRKGFELLALGFTGREAIGLTLAYIHAFEGMATLLKNERDGLKFDESRVEL